MYSELLLEIENITNKKDLDDAKIKFFGKNGIITNLMKQLSAMSIEEKKIQGKEINILKENLKQIFHDKEQLLIDQEWQHKLQKEIIDVSIPCNNHNQGRFHPIMHSMSELIEIFASLGFETIFGNDIESTFFNFSTLRVPEHHPSRSTSDTFYIDDNHVLRTHTTAIQVKYLQKNNPPVRIVSTGRTYRSDYLDQTHAPMFHQMDVVAVDKDINMGHLKWIMEEFLRLFFNKKIEIRFRSSFFPFTEPSAEIDILFNGKWLEVLGCGMIHPEILSSCNIDTSIYTGFAAGFGIERLTMIKYGINDIRPLFINDNRWLSHYGFFSGD